MTTRSSLLPIFLLILLLSPTVIAGAEDSQQHQAPEPRVKVITRPEWISGQVAVHIFSFPNDGATLQQDTIIVQVAVWGTEQNRPVYIVLDGEEAARIEAPGYYRYEWDLQGSHHITLRDDYTLFKTAQFNIAPPPPLPQTILLEKAKQEMQEQKMLFLGSMLTASLAGVGLGAYLKRRTKKFWGEALTPFGILMVLGYLQIDELYMLIPLGLTAAASYIGTGSFVSTLGLLSIDPENPQGGPRFETIEQDDEERVILGLGLQYWRYGFMKTMPIDIKNKNMVMFENEGHFIPTLVIEKKEILETKLKVTCNHALAELMKKKGVVTELTRENQQLSIRNNLLEAGAVGNLQHKFTTALAARVMALMEGVNTQHLELPGIFNPGDDVEKMSR